MAKLFQITLPDGMSELKLDSQGRATLQYNVANKSARPIDDARADSGSPCRRAILLTRIIP